MILVEQNSKFPFIHLIIRYFSFYIIKLSNFLNLFILSYYFFLHKFLKIINNFI